MNVWRLMAYHVPEQIEAVIAHSRRTGVLAIGAATGDLTQRFSGHRRTSQNFVLKRTRNLTQVHGQTVVSRFTTFTLPFNQVISLSSAPVRIAPLYSA